ncbi:MAG: hypothetical protein ACI8RD_014149 [Bacillariaceae sp.]
MQTAVRLSAACAPYFRFFDLSVLYLQSHLTLYKKARQK